MTFYTAVGSYQMRTENGREMPYILRMGRMEPISIPEFFIWSHLLWEVETYDEIREFYQNQSKSLGVRLPNLDQALKMLIKRKLIAKGIGYTGEDALYDMLSAAFVLPIHTLGKKKLSSVIRLLVKGRITGREAIRAMRPEHLTGDENRVMKLVRQTPLSVSELIRCIENGVWDVDTPEKVITAIYTDEEDTQERMQITSRQADCKTAVLEAVANLYLRRRVMLDMA
jgi:hypothetical protein